MKQVPAIAAWIALLALVLGGGACRRAPRTGGATEKTALLAGASGELGEDNFFLQDLRELAEALRGRGWAVSMVAGARDGLVPGSMHASGQNLSEGVKRFLGDAKPGAQALLVFHSHGRERETYWGQKSHSIASEDRDSSGFEPGFDLDSIEPELLKARQRGVRVALVDLSCYSGATQELEGPVCTVTLASSRYVSLCSGRPEERTFSSRFLKLPPPGTAVDLESQFVESRRQDRESINLPRISSRQTPALEAWEEFLVRVDPLDTFEDLKGYRPGTEPFKAHRLLSELDRWQATQSSLPVGFAALRAGIARELESVLAVRKRLERQLAPLAKDYDQAFLSVSLSGRRPTRLSSGYLAELLAASGEGRVPEGYTQPQRAFLAALEPARTEITARFGKLLSDHQKRKDRFDADLEALERGAGRLFALERVLYDLAPGTTQASACREFGL